jgi:hypothetical protein
MNIDYFIIGHNPSQTINHQDINHKFLVVGNYTEKNDETIICKNLPINIENYPFLCSFTAWYAVAKNNLYQNEYICLLEYDVVKNALFHTANMDIINRYHNIEQYIIAYNKTITNHFVFTKSTPWLELSLKYVYNIDLINFVEQYAAKLPFWPTSTNILLHYTVLNKFVNWFEPMIEIFKDEPLGAYVHERAFFVFCAINNINIRYSLDTLYHHQNQSHNICDIYGSVLQKNNTKYLSNNIKNQYNEIYNQALRSAEGKMLNKHG